MIGERYGQWLPKDWPLFKFVPSTSGQYADLLDAQGVIVGHVRRGEIQEVVGASVAVLALEVVLTREFAERSGFRAVARDLVEGNGFAAYADRRQIGRDT